MLTVIIKTKNSEETIPETLESVKDLGKIVVIDEHSTDDTILLAKEYKAQIFYSSLNEFNLAYNQAISETENDWILMLEGDEIIPDKLGQNILNYIENPKKNKNAVLIPNKFFYLNKEIKSARNYRIKLYKKDSAELINGYSTELKPLKTKKYKFNFGFKNDKNCVLKFEKKDIYSIFQNKINEIIIKSKEDNKKQASVIIKPFLKFITFYFIKGAMFDGRRGFIYSTLKAIECFIQECSKFEYIKKEN